MGGWGYKWWKCWVTFFIPRRYWFFCQTRNPMSYKRVRGKSDWEKTPFKRRQHVDKHLFAMRRHTRHTCNFCYSSQHSILASHCQQFFLQIACWTKLLRHRLGEYCVPISVPTLLTECPHKMSNIVSLAKLQFLPFSSFSTFPSRCIIAIS